MAQDLPEAANGKDGTRPYLGLSLPYLIILLIVLIGVLVTAALLLAKSLRHSLPSEPAVMQPDDGVAEAVPQSDGTEESSGAGALFFDVSEAPPTAEPAATAAPTATATPAATPARSELSDGEHVLSRVSFEELTPADGCYTVYAEWYNDAYITMTEEQVRALKVGDVLAAGDQDVLIEDMADVRYDKDAGGFGFIFGEYRHLLVDDYYSVDDGRFDDNTALYGVGINGSNARGCLMYDYYVLYAERTATWYVMYFWMDPDPTLYPCTDSTLQAGQLRLRSDLNVFISENFFTAYPPYAAAAGGGCHIPVSSMRQYWRQDRDLELLPSSEAAIVRVTVKDGTVTAMRLDYAP